MNHYNQKDITKFAKCTKLISRGAPGSSSDKYSKGQMLSIPIDSINATEYSPEDIVGISVNGARRGRLTFDKTLVDLAMTAGAMFITDNLYNRNRSFNVGEREVAYYLSIFGYTFHDHEKGGYWTI